MTPEKKSRPLDVKLEIKNAKDWKKRGNITVKVRGMFRNSGWKVKDHSSKIKGDVLDVTINAEHSGGLAAMVLKPFEITEEVQVEKQKDHLKIRVIIDGDECATHNL